VGDKGKVDVCYMLNSTTSIYCGSYNSVPNTWNGSQNSETKSVEGSSQITCQFACFLFRNKVGKLVMSGRKHAGQMAQPNCLGR
jgi:hypothetical protein